LDLLVSIEDLLIRLKYTLDEKHVDMGKQRILGQRQLHSKYRNTDSD